MATPTPETTSSSLELRSKRWTAVAVVCFMGLLAALPFRSAPQIPNTTVASSHRERSLRFRADTLEPASYPRIAVEKTNADIQPVHSQFKPVSSPVASETFAPSTTTQLVDPTGSPTATEPSIEPSEEDSGWRSKASASVSNVPRSCVAQRGENLMDIAERVLGDRLRWKELVELNPKYRSGFDEIGEGEEILTPGGK
jgi:nucleoid-associated protein YgaU